MSYLEESLSKGEVIVERFHLHWIAWLNIWICYGLILTIPLAIYHHMRLRFTEFGLTNRRVVLKTGIVARNTEEMNLSRIETIEIKQTISGRLMGYGDIVITGVGVSDLRYHRIANPMSVKRRIEDQRFAENDESPKKS